METLVEKFSVCVQQPCNAVFFSKVVKPKLLLNELRRSSMPGSHVHLPFTCEADYHFMFLLDCNMSKPQKIEFLNKDPFSFKDFCRVQNVVRCCTTLESQFVNGNAIEPLCICFMSARSKHYSRAANGGNGSAEGDCRAGFGAGPNQASM